MKLLSSVSLLSLIGAAGVAWADPPTTPADQALSTIIVTGTRTGGVKAVDSAAPIETVDAASLRRLGQPDLIQGLAQNFPGFTAQAAGDDQASLVLSLSLRGLSPNDTLVLVDGKRRHTTDNLAIDSGSGPYQGGASADLSFIPGVSIDHIEVLEDGAAAQYGTDAVAGVVNIILKKNTSGGSLTASTGEFYRQQGATPDLTGSWAFAPTPNSFLDLFFESKFHDHTDVGALDPRILTSPLIKEFPDYPHVNHNDGDAAIQLNVVSFNAGDDLGGGVEAYAFGSFGRKYANGFANYRVPSKLPALYPLGFNPEQSDREFDGSITGGLRADSLLGWAVDLSTTFGEDHTAVYTVDSGNVSLYNNTGSTPSAAHDGDFISSQWTTNLDVNRDFAVGLASPLNVAYGAEFRHETYQITQGDYASTYREGLQSYPGFTATDAGSHGRDNEAAYLDLSASPIEKLKIDAAGRFEHFSDFGSTEVAKATGRYDFSPQVAVRGTVSSGFRAPTLAEEYYSTTNVQPTSAFVQLPPNSVGAKLIGVDGLKPEQSQNYSIGFVTHPLSKLVASLDFYQININNRIVGTGKIFATGQGYSAPAVTAAIEANGNILDPAVVATGNTGVQIFANGLSTKTQGAEFVLNYPSNFGELGRVDWSLSADYNHTVVTRINPTPTQLHGQLLYNKAAISDVTTATPLYRINMGAFYRIGPWAVDVKEIIYGQSQEYELGDNNIFYLTKIPAAPITNLNIDYVANSHTKFSVGAANLFDIYPPHYNQALLNSYIAAKDNAAVRDQPGISPYGIDGGYFYGKVTFTF